MATTLSRDEIEECKDVFDVFLYFWGTTEGAVDAFKVGDMLFCLGFNPTTEIIVKNGGAKTKGEKTVSIEDFLQIYADVSKIEETGTFNDFNECFKTFDREGQGFISSAELRHVLEALGDKLSEKEVNYILKVTETKEDLDGNFKYADFISKVLKGPFEEEKK